MADYTWMNKKMIVFIILFGNVIHNSAYVSASYNNTSDLMLHKLIGEWQFTGGIYPVNVTCGRVTLYRTSEHRVKGVATGVIDGTWRKIVIQAYVRDDIFSVRYSTIYTISQEYSFWMNTCHDESEISLFLDEEKLHLIFGRNSTISPENWEYYEELSSHISSKLRVADNVGCKESI